MGDWLTSDFFSIVAAAFVVGSIVGLTGMGGGALMTPALIFLGVGGASTVVTADLTASAIYKSGGAITHAREGKPNWALRLVINLHRSRHGGLTPDPDPKIRPLVTVAVGALGGFLVGITSVGSGSVIMISLVMLYPGLSALRLVGTDLVQAVPLVTAAAISNIALNGLDWHLLVPLLIGSVPGSILGSHIAPRVKQSYIRRGIVIVLTMSGLALLDKSGWAPLGAGEDQTHPELIALTGLAMVFVLPFVWGLIRRAEGMPMFGSPTVAELEGEVPADPRPAESGTAPNDQAKLP
jgi:uncharacterized membrane protein YfcA